MRYYHSSKNSHDVLERLRRSLPTFGQRPFLWQAFGDCEPDFREQFIEFRQKCYESFFLSSPDSYHWLLLVRGVPSGWAELSVHESRFKKAYLSYQLNSLEDNSSSYSNTQKQALTFLITASIFFSRCDVLKLFISERNNCGFLEIESKRFLKPQCPNLLNLDPLEEVKFLEIVPADWLSSKLGRETKHKLNFLNTRFKSKEVDDD